MASTKACCCLGVAATLCIAAQAFLPAAPSQQQGQHRQSECRPATSPDCFCRGTQFNPVVGTSLQMTASSSDGNHRFSQQRRQQQSWGQDADEAVRLPDITAPELLLSEEERVSLWLELGHLEPQLEQALHAEDFTTAEQLRDTILALKIQDPYFSLRQSFDTALARDDFYSAAKFKLQLHKLGPPAALLESASCDANTMEMGPSVRTAIEAARAAQAAAAADERRERDGSTSSGGSGTAGEALHVYSTRSEAVTNGVRIEARSVYLPEQSDPQRGQCFFVYRVRITNESPGPLQLLSRRWDIRTANPKTGRTVVEQVSGPGVVGQMPLLEPGESFDYSAACPVQHGSKGDKRVLARMEGAMSMAPAGDLGAAEQAQFEAQISPFYLILPEEVQAW